MLTYGLGVKGRYDTLVLYGEALERKEKDEETREVTKGADAGRLDDALMIVVPKP